MEDFEANCVVLWSLLGSCYIINVLDDNEEVEESSIISSFEMSDVQITELVFVIIKSTQCALLRSQFQSVLKTIKF